MKTSCTATRMRIGSNNRKAVANLNGKPADLT